MRLTGRELSGTRARVERTAGRLGNPQRAQAANAVSGVRSNEELASTPRGTRRVRSTRALLTPRSARRQLELVNRNRSNQHGISQQLFLTSRCDKLILSK